jgi:hypothetical protein
MALFTDLGMHLNIPAVADNIETMKTIIRQDAAARLPAAAAAEEAERGIARARVRTGPPVARALPPADARVWAREAHLRCSPSCCAAPALQRPEPAADLEPAR